MAITDGRITRLADDDERFRIAMPQTTYFEYAALQISVLNNFLHCLQDFECAGGPPTGGRTDQDDRFLVVPKMLPMGRSPFSYLIEGELSIWLSRFFQSFAPLESPLLAPLEGERLSNGVNLIFFFFLKLKLEKDTVHPCGISFGFHFSVNHRHRGHCTTSHTSHRIEIEFAVGCGLTGLYF